MAKTQEQPIPFHRLCRLTIVGGFLDGVDIEFAPGLNCIIGGRGTGKTTVVELIRFALDAMPDEATAKRVRSLITKEPCLGRVELAIQTSSGMNYVISRSHDGEPVVMTENRKPTDLLLKSGSLFSADIYSQNEVESIADRAHSQLDLIDSFDRAEITELSMRASRIALEATGLSKEVAQVRNKIAALQEETSELRNVEEEMKGMATAGTGDVAAINQAHAQRGLRDREKRAIERLTGELGRYGENMKALIGVLDRESRATISSEILTGANKAVFEKIRHAFSGAGCKADGHLRDALAALEECWSRLQEHNRELTAAHGAQEIAFQALIEKQQVAQGEANKRSTLETRRNKLLARLQEQKAEEEKLATLEEKRAKVLHDLAEIRDVRYAKRKAICERLTAAFASEIRVTVIQDGNKDLYRDKLDELLKGARIQEASKAKLLDLFPGELVQVVAKGDVKGLVEKTGLADPTASKVISILANSDGLHELETAELVDEPRIELNDEGTWKDSGDLSTGQKCTAILPILLMESEKPLLVDQPEDNLDNRYVSDKVVGTIASVKKHRQLIFVTHNPNIPVLGDAERVFVLDSTGKSGGILNQGTVDHCRDEIILFLEGGEKAFDIRRERYHR